MEYLSKCRDVLQKFNNNLTYCHWKSNEHLEAGLNGETDLDILVDKSEVVMSRRILAECGFQKFSTSNSLSHRGADIYIGFDEESGKLIHIHVHYRLMLGNDLKQYYLPWERFILSNRIYRNDACIYTIDPNLEMLLLLIRYSFKLDRREYLLNIVSNRYPPENAIREYNWLSNRMDKSEVMRYSFELINEDIKEHVDSLLTEFSIWNLRKFKGALKNELELYKSHTLFRKWYLWIKQRITKQVYWRSRDMELPHSFKRTLPTGGKIIAIIGPDGAGKSTISKEIDKWLSWKVDSYYMYMGSADNSTISSLVLNSINSVFGISDWNPNEISPETQSGHKTFIWKIFTGIHVLVKSHSRRKKLKKIWTARNNGAIVITDRYPQNQIPHINDGPALIDWRYNSSKIQRAIANWEEKPYQWAEKNPPDLIIKLNVDPTRSANRAKETDIEKITRKIESFNLIEFNNSNIINIDANQSKERVLSNVKIAVWNEILNRSPNTG